ncbi:MAG: hypothetical protein ACE5PV_00240 [Candidatus Poribacteria bacterium]
MVNFHRAFVQELMDNPRFKVFLYVTGMVCLGTFGIVLDYLSIPIGYIVLAISALVLPLGYGMYILGRQMGIISKSTYAFTSIQPEETETEIRDFKQKIMSLLPDTNLKSEQDELEFAEEDFPELFSVAAQEMEKPSELYKKCFTAADYELSLYSKEVPGRGVVIKGKYYIKVPKILFGLAVFGPLGIVEISVTGAPIGSLAGFYAYASDAVTTINGRKYRVMRAICAWKKVIGKPPAFPVLLKLVEFDNISEEELRGCLTSLEDDGFLKQVADDPLTYDVA